ncbi:MAG: zinc metallopeptidase [Chloroflexota bacterium]|nr:zinc metallopeptidase [Chloroflexota bacterium]
MFWFDPNYFWYIFIPTILLSLGVQIYLKRTFSKWSKVENAANLTGREVADVLIEETPLEPIPVERTKQPLGDHYDPKENVVRLSPPVGDADSVSAMAVTAHEFGHVQQYQTGSSLIKARSFLLPAVMFSPTIMYISALLGLLFNMTNLLWVAIIFFGLTVLFSLLTLPVEFDASKRGLTMLREDNLFGSEEEAAGARKVLTAAALTYVAAFITSVLQFVYYFRGIHQEIDRDKAQEAKKEARQQTSRARR